MQNKIEVLKILKLEGLNNKLKRPLYLDSAKSAGYSVKDTFAVVRRIKKGNHRHPLPTKGRAPSKYYSYYSAKLSGKRIAEQRVLSKFINCKVIGSYKIFHHSGFNYYELILKPYASTS